MTQETDEQRALPPCPFCGPRGYPKLEFGERTGYWYIECTKCGGRTGLKSSEYHAIEAWQARAAQPAVAQWQPIASAPKNGTVVIVGRHMDEFGFIRGYARFDGSPTAYVSGWISTGFDPVMSNFGLAHPTHWMPLPNPPNSEETGEPR